MWRLCTNPSRLGRPRIACTLAFLGQKSHHLTPAQPYNSHSAATQPRGFVQQGLSALTRLGARPIIVAVRMKPYSIVRRPLKNG